ncbi:hypothetical protein [Paenibacillus glucanolyticus]|uniref:hypothetical protein n=1 Tax=Paenibacillus glucanolyticus TaxID=59843 RepID=UPI00096EC97E|nr:hypothetical protein [Paenibacillus glucanolyticus]OMF76639.1 hypothetical protein BK142_14015 [Paenibacillus glucanolyticus]
MRLTEEDLVLVKNYLKLPVVMDVLQNNMDKIESSDLKMQALFAAHLSSLSDKVNRELYDVRQEMRKRGLKVYEERRSEKGISAKYLCRGYNHEMNLLWGLVKSETETKIADLLGVDIEKIEFK